MKPTSKRRKQSEPRENRGLKYALGLLKSRPRSCFEVVAKLRLKGFDDHQANSVVATLLEARLLDDERFARDWVRYRDRLRPSGEWLLRHELHEKGLAERLIEQTIANRQTPEWFEEIGLTWDGRSIELHLAQQIVESRERRMTNLTPEKRITRLAGVLERRGFHPPIIWQAVKAPLRYTE